MCRTARSVCLLALALSASVFAATPTLRVHLRLDETTGTDAIDSSGNGNNGLYANGPFFVPFGRVDRAIRLGGNAEAITMAASNTILANTSTITFAGWVKPTVLPNANTRLVSFSLPTDAGIARFVVRVLASANGLNARIDAGARATDNTAEAAQFRATTASVLNLEEYTHVAAVVDYPTDTIRLYINGTEAAATGTVAFTPTVTPNTPALAGAFGATSNNSGEQFRGEMDDLRLYTGPYDNLAAEAAFIAALASPAINAGPDQLVPPGTTVTLNATINPTPASLAWSLVSGPGAVVFGSPTSSTTTFTHTVPGAYLVRLTANFGTYVSHDEVYIGESPAAHYKLDESIGASTADAIGNLTPGALLPSGDSAAWVPTAKIDGGLNFDGTNDRVRLPANNNLIRNASAISFSAWVKIPSVTSTATRVISSFSTNAAGTTRASFRISNAGNLQLGVRGTDVDGGYSINAPAALTANTYHHLAGICNYRTNRLELFVNGASVVVATPATAGEFRDLKISDTASVAAAIGGLYTEAAEYFGGEIDDLRIYTRPLSRDEVAGLAAINVKNDSYTVAEDGALNATIATGVLANDTSLLAVPLPLSASVVGNVSNGSLTLNPNGSFAYTPAANFFGTDCFTYRANDGTATSVLGVVTIQVSEVNDAPVGVADSGPGLSTDEDTALAIAPATLLANDTAGAPNEAVQALSVSAVSAASAQGGTVTILGNGTIQYMPAVNFAGTDTFTYTVTDNGTTNGSNDFRSSSGVTVTVDVRTVNDAPTAATDSAMVAEDSVAGISVNVASNDSPGPTLTGAGNEATQALTVSLPSLASAQGGTLSLAGNNVVYVPAANFNGMDSFTYTITDNGQSNGVDDFQQATGTVNVTVTPADDNPVASNDAYTTRAGRLLSVAAPGVLANDTDVDAGQTTTLQAVLATSPVSGTVILQSDGSFTYMPAGAFVGTVTFTYQARDTALLLSNTATVTINVQVNDAPVASNASVTVAEDTPQSFLFAVADSTLDPLSITVQTPPARGTLVVTDGIGAPTFLYAPALNVTGTDSFTYLVSDGLTSAAATVSITITPVNDTPVAVDGTLEVGLNFPRAGAFIGSDPVENNPLAFSVVAPPANGTVAITNAANGTFLYTPANGFLGGDAFTFRVNDGTSNSNTATITITVVPPPAFTSQPVVVPNPVNVGQPVSGTATATNVIVSWNWGDGTQSNGGSVSHIYASTGVYAVTTTLASANGLTTVLTQDVFVGANLNTGSSGNGGGANAPGIVIGEGGLGPKQGGKGKIICNYVKREKSSYSGSLKGLALPASLTQAALENRDGILIIGSGASSAQFRFTLNKRGTGKSTGLPQVKFDVKKGAISFKAQRADLTSLTESLGGVQRFDNVRQVQLLSVPVSLQIGREIYVMMTFQLKFVQTGTSGKGGL